MISQFSNIFNVAVGMIMTVGGKVTGEPIITVLGGLLTTALIYKTIQDGRKASAETDEIRGRIKPVDETDVTQ